MPLRTFGPEDLDAPQTEAERQEMVAIERLTTNAQLLKTFDILDKQLNALHLRGTAVITIVGVVVTVTGFSGRIIAGTSTFAQTCVIGGLALCIAAAAVTFAFVMPIRWITSYLHLGQHQWLLTAIRRRNRKTRAFRFAAFLLIIGIALYGIAIAQMLAFPFAYENLNARLILPEGE
ncbi:MAG: hypothetical protein RLY93_10220 [Sumerlaeia bacterium]